MQVHNSPTLVADDFALARRGRLQEVLMKLDGEYSRAEGSFHQDGCGVFDVDLEITPVPAEGVDAAGQAEQRVEVIKLVYLREDDAAPEVGAGRIHDAVVLVGVPVRKVLANGCTDAKQVAKNSGAHDLGKPDDAWMKAELVAHHGDASVLAGQVDEFGRAVERVGQRLLEEDIAAGDQAGSRHHDMQAAGVADVSDVEPFGERLVERVEGADVVHLLDIALLIRAHRRRNDVSQPPHTIRDDLHRIAEQRAKVTGVALANAAESNDEYFQRELLKCVRVRMTIASIDERKRVACESSSPRRRLPRGQPVE